MDTVLPSFSVLLGQSPVYLVWIVGMGLCGLFWQKQPRVALLALIALIGFFISSVVGSLISMWLPIRLQEQGMAFSQISMILTGVGIIRALISAVLWALILAAIFGWRGEESPSKNNMAKNDRVSIEAEEIV